MKKATATSVSRALLLAAMCLPLAACPDVVPGPDNKPASIVIDPSPASVQSGQSVQLTTTITNKSGDAVTGATGTISYSSANRLIASVSADGLVTGAQTGTTDIAASLGTITGTTSVSVTAGAPASVTKSTDLTQSIAAGSSNSIGVKVVDAAKNPVSGVTVDFATSAGGGTITPASATTNELGVATASYKVGDVVGANSATATVAGIATPVTFSATTVAGPASTITKVSTDPATVIAGDKFGSGIRVRIKDALGNVRSGVSVAFAAAAGGGTVSPATVITDANGDAATTFTTGKTVGANTATAKANGITEPVIFSITTIPGPVTGVGVSTPVTTLSVSGTAEVGASARDKNNNAVAGTTFTYTSRSPGVATVSSSGVVTAVAAGQALIVASAAAGSDSMFVAVRPTDGPLLITDLTKFALTPNTNVVVTILMDMTASPERLGSTSVKVEWDPTVMTYQSSGVATGGPTPAVNTSTATTGSLAFSIASATGFSGKVAMLKVTFRGGAAGKTGTLKLSASEVTSAETFTNLLPKTIAVTMPIIIR